MARTSKPEAAAKPAVSARKPARQKAAGKQGGPGESTYTADQIMDGYRAFDYPKIITHTAIRRDGGAYYTHQEAKKVIDAFARRDPLKGVK